MKIRRDRVAEWAHELRANRTGVGEIEPRGVVASYQS